MLSEVSYPEEAFWPPFFKTDCSSTRRVSISPPPASHTPLYRALSCTSHCNIVPYRYVPGSCTRIVAKLRDDQIGAVLDLSPALLFFGVETFTFHISPHAVCSAVRYRPTDRSRSRSTSLFFFATANVRDSTTSTTRNKLVKYDRVFFPISLVFAPQKQAWQMSQSPKTKVGIPLKRPRRKPERERKEEKSRNGGQSVRAAPNRNVGNGVPEDFFSFPFRQEVGRS